MNPENIDFLNQLANSLEKAQTILEESYKRGDSAYFSKVKKFILQIQEKVFEVIE